MNIKQLGATLAFVIVGILVVKGIGKKVGGGLGTITAGI